MCRGFVMLVFPSQCANISTASIRRRLLSLFIKPVLKIMMVSARLMARNSSMVATLAWSSSMFASGYFGGGFKGMVIVVEEKNSQLWLLLPIDVYASLNFFF